MSNDAIVVIGGGHAGAQICATLAELGQAHRVHLVCEEASLPYQRPPLSKAFFKKNDEPIQLIRAQTWFDQQGITVHLGDAVKNIDLQARVAHLASNKSLPFSKLVSPQARVPSDWLNCRHRLRTFICSEPPKTLSS